MAQTSSLTDAERRIVSTAAEDRALARRCVAHGISVATFVAQYLQQKGRCGVCRELRGYPALVIDHNHSTGEFRGLLCAQCNAALGLLADRKDYAVSAAKYLGRAGTSGKRYSARGHASQCRPVTQVDALARIRTLEGFSRLTACQRAELAELRASFGMTEATGNRSEEERLRGLGFIPFSPFDLAEVWSDLQSAMADAQEGN